MVGDATALCCCIRVRNNASSIFKCLWWNVDVDGSKNKLTDSGAIHTNNNKEITTKPKHFFFENS